MAEKGAEVEKGPRRWETGSPIHLPGQLCSPAAPAELPLPADPTGRPQLPAACPCGARTLPVPGVQAGLPPLPVSMVVVADDITDIPLSPFLTGSWRGHAHRKPAQPLPHRVRVHHLSSSTGTPGTMAYLGGGGETLHTRDPAVTGAAWPPSKISPEVILSGPRMTVASH